MSVECDNVKSDEETPTNDSTTETQDITTEPTLTQITSFPEKIATKTFEVKESSGLTGAIREAAEVVVSLIPSVLSDQDDVQTHTDEEISEACAKSSDAGEPTEEASSTEVQAPDSEKRCKSDETEHVEETAGEEAIQKEQTTEPDQVENRPDDNLLKTTTEDVPTDESSLETPMNTPQVVVAQ
ncbi:hypothetical protein PHET_05869 [Paragonimus heterotremus]|uniref:Uncharacterized protein n=1 Tax=Paragonimus heterotremus TaxID=100268 RepID=A0A8J4WGK3_9TREM|nr:hypothetical protein PHET_05869 [Paragonimus heterotremus]